MTQGTSSALLGLCHEAGRIARRLERLRAATLVEQHRATARAPASAADAKAISAWVHQAHSTLGDAAQALAGTQEALAHTLVRLDYVRELYGALPAAAFHADDELPPVESTLPGVHPLIATRAAGPSLVARSAEHQGRIQKSGGRRTTRDRVG